MSLLERRQLFSSHITKLSLVLEVLVVLSLLAGAIPVSIAQPVWWLRLADAIVNLAPVVLLAVMLLRLADVMLESGNTMPFSSGSRRGFRTASRWALVFTLLVPLQLLGFAWLWADSDSQVSLQIRQGESAVAALRTRVMASRSETELLQLLASTNPGPLPPRQPGSLLEQKQQISEAISINTSRLSSTLRAQRSSMLRNTLPGTLRGVIGAAIVSSFLLLLRRQI